jgi:hypothetical protein
MNDKRLTISIPVRWLRISLAVLLVTAVVVPGVAGAAGGSFIDDETSIFEGDIEWLADAGVTRGCNPPTNDRFCPNDEVTRGQMAAFMRRFAQFLGAEDGTVSEADRVGGFAANELVRVDGCWEDNPMDGTDYQCDFELRAPVEGMAALTGFVDLSSGSPGDIVICRFRVDGSVVESSAAAVVASPASANCTSAAVVPLTAGRHTIGFEVYAVGIQTSLASVAAHGVYSAHNGGGN